MKAFKNIDEYINKADKIHQAKLQEVRSIVQKTPPITKIQFLKKTAF